jgi:tetratricopeptide (TPR) repeat protein
MTRRAALLACALALVASVFLVYAPVAGHAWIAYDDDVYLTANPHVARGLAWDQVRWVFTHELAGNYHPLTWLAHMLDVELFGLESGPHQLVNVGWHALNAVLVLLLLAALLEHVWAAGLGAALFALHPLRVESVAWAAERKDVLCASFFLAGLLAWLRYARAPSTGRYLAVCLALVLALLAKPMAVTFPLVVLLLDLGPLRRLRAASGQSLGSLLREKVPLFALAGLGAAATLWAQARAGATSSLGGLPPELRVLNALASLAAYLRQTLVPRGLSVFYPHAQHLSDDPVRVLSLPALAGALLLAGLLTLAWRLRRAAPVVTAGVGIFLVTLLPVIGLVQVGIQAHADRYTYLPSLGLVAGASALALHVCARAGAQAGAHRARALAALGLAATVWLALLAWRQVGLWADTRTLFEHALSLDERNFLAHSKLGELALADGDLARASTALERAAEWNPNHVESLSLLGLVRLRGGDPRAARAPLERALRLDPGRAATWQNLGSVELALGAHGEARRCFEQARALDPSSGDGSYNLGYLAQLEGDPARAEGLFLEALALEPGHVSAWNGLGQARLDSGRPAAALEAFERAARLDPADAGLQFNQGLAQRALGAHAEAAQAFRRALALDPAFAPARIALRALEGSGR